MGLYERINERYFDWIRDIVHGGGYTLLLTYLHNTTFTYTIAMDANRESDGIDLRYKFGREYGLSDVIIANCLDNSPCSVLEMMAALAMRCEDELMGDPDIGDRTSVWFMNMLSSLGLDDMTDFVFDERIVEKRINIFLDREYASNGCGGLFTIRHPRRDLRSVEIWYQAMWYFDELIA